MQKTKPKCESFFPGLFLNQQDAVNTALVLRVVSDLSKAAPNNLSTSSDQTQLADIDLDNRTLRQDSQLRIHGVLGILLDGDDG